MVQDLGPRVCLFWGVGIPCLDIEHPRPLTLHVRRSTLMYLEARFMLGGSCLFVCFGKGGSLVVIRVTAGHKHRVHTVE